MAWISCGPLPSRISSTTRATVLSTSNRSLPSIVVAGMSKLSARLAIPSPAVTSRVVVVAAIWLFSHMNRTGRS